jgi:hypothetical protein
LKQGPLIASGAGLFGNFFYNPYFRLQHYSIYIHSHVFIPIKLNNFLFLRKVMYNLPAAKSDNKVGEIGQDNRHRRRTGGVDGSYNRC